MPVVPNLVERLVLFRLNRGPAPMLDLFGAAGFESVAMALELDLFEALAAAGESLSASELAERIDAHPDGVETLCSFLAVLGYLDEEGARYGLTAMTERWLIDDSATDMGPWFTFWAELVFPFWERELETAIREGEPSQSIYEFFDEEPGRWAIAQDGFRATASLLVDDVVDALTIPGDADRLLDVGGGHGLYAVELCRRHPELSATVLDVAGAIDAMREEVPDDVADRIDGQIGDYRSDDLGGPVHHGAAGDDGDGEAGHDGDGEAGQDGDGQAGDAEGYDVALLFNVIHAHDPAENVALFERVADALAPGGRLAVMDQWAGSARSPVSRAGLGFVALTYQTTLGATVYSREEVTGWLERAGFSRIRHRSLGPLSGMGLLEATK